ncbi:adenosylmethionine decarboxylase [Candidatus Korarchaeum cryptofilum]|jgi:S-adenosylmethionine decarboxylase proenzyme|uniref:S-adenosylmethionine decarboxylase related n=1 Tax=Korarchaeum cryptofilum (strain OPF8) TaxID=374847 RepID=B1L7I7_KORCO|nr:adenosylmethionine decarboxylase [Candidatus Korarchaeum cryptofilum]ACB06814.1 S-adenosylmethionine decarboxylase related [Candidatus Korarchaeum cryptofilum OPF8]
MSSEIRPKETQVIAELYDVAEKDFLDSPELMKKLLQDAADESGVKVLHIHVHEFEPYGVSGFLMTDKGYVAIHTWPEHSYATINIVSFSEPSWSWDMYKIMAKFLKPRQQSAVEIKSGLDFR